MGDDKRARKLWVNLKWQDVDGLSGFAVDPRSPYDANAPVDDLMYELTRRMTWLRVHYPEVTEPLYQSRMRGVVALAAAFGSAMRDAAASFAGGGR